MGRRKRRGFIRNPRRLTVPISRAERALRGLAKKHGLQVSRDAVERLAKEGSVIVGQATINAVRLARERGHRRIRDEDVADAIRQVLYGD